MVGYSDDGMARRRRPPADDLPPGDGPSQFAPGPVGRRVLRLPRGRGVPQQEAAAEPARGGDQVVIRAPAPALPPAPTALFTGIQFRAVHDTLLDAIPIERGLFLLTGERGIGKTALLARLRRDLHDAGCSVVVVRARAASVSAIASALSRVLGIAEAAANEPRWLEDIRQCLAERGRDAAPIVLEIDDADILADDVLAALGVLLDVPEGQPLALAVLLAGRPGLRPRLGAPPLALLAARLVKHRRLERLGEREIAALLRLRQRIEGEQSGRMLEDAVIAAIARAAGGVPGRAVRLAEEALRAGRVGSPPFARPMPAEPPTAWPPPSHPPRPAAFRPQRAADAVASHRTLSRKARSRRHRFMIATGAGLALTTGALLAFLPADENEAGVKRSMLAALTARLSAPTPLEMRLALTPPEASAATSGSSTDEAPAASGSESPGAPADLGAPEAADANGADRAGSSAEADAAPPAPDEADAEANPASTAAAETTPAAAPSGDHQQDRPVAAEATAASSEGSAPPSQSGVPAPPDAAPASAPIAPTTEPQQDSAPRDAASVTAPAPVQAPVEPNLPSPTAAPPAIAEAPPGEGSPVAAASVTSAERPPSSTALNPAAIATLMRRGQEMLAQGDIAAARLFYERAATADARAATAAGKTYDPSFLRTSRARGVMPRPDRAAEWYRVASEGGDAEAAILLKRLQQTSP